MEEVSEERSLAPGWTNAALLLLGVALLLRQPYLVLLGLTISLLLLITRLWGRHALSRVTYHRTLAPASAFFGDEVELVVRVANHKALPLPWLTMQEELPAALPVIGMASLASYMPRRRLLTANLDLGPYQAVTRRYRLYCTTRGYHKIGPSTLRAGDVFGLIVQRKTLSASSPLGDHLIVYPRIVDLDDLGLAARYPLGEMRSAQRLYEDPTLLAGIREYVPGDSPRRVHWKATARTGRLQVKTFDPSATLDVLIALDVTTVAPDSWASDDDLLEFGISAAASLAYAFLEARRPVGLLTNGFLSGMTDEVRIPPGSGPQQLPAVLDALARLGPWSRGSLSALLLAHLGVVPPGATLTVIAALLTLDLAEALLAYRAAGYAVSLLLLGDGKGRALAPTLPGVDVHYLGGASRWRELQALPISPAGQIGAGVRGRDEVAV